MKARIAPVGRHPTNLNNRRNGRHQAVNSIASHKKSGRPVSASVVATSRSPGKFIEHPLQRIMSRTGSFPLRVAYQLLAEEAVAERSIIFDPFCGKGTTLLAARLLGHSAYGIDVAPEAVVCTRAKMNPPTLRQFVTYITRIHTRRVYESVPDEVRVFFHPETLNDILAIRRRLLIDMTEPKTRQMALFALAVLLGILHGHASYSLSISSAHAYSMSPRYVSRYAVEHDLKPPERDVRVCLIQKASIVLAGETLPKARFGVKRASALAAGHAFRQLRGKIDIILTSPPYLHAQTYPKDNWLRLWLLGFNRKHIQRDYLQTSSTTLYAELMTKALAQCVDMLRPGGKLICVAGDVRLPRPLKSHPSQRVFPTGLVLADLCRKHTAFRVTTRLSHEVASSSRYYHALSASNGHGKNTLVERIFVARKSQL